MEIACLTADRVLPNTEWSLQTEINGKTKPHERVKGCTDGIGERRLGGTDPFESTDSSLC